MLRITRQSPWSIVVMGLMFIFLCGCLNAGTSQQIKRIQEKAKIAKQGVMEWKRSGKDPSNMLELMALVKPALDKKKFNEAESLLDDVLARLKTGQKSATAEVSPQQRIERIKEKAERAKQGVIARKRSGQDVSSLLKLMSQVKPTIDKGKFNEAEALLDEVLAMLGSTASTAIASQQDDEQTTDEFVNPEKISIVGYSGDAMEPFISRDGNYLFFNNLNDPHVNTNIHYAEKIDEQSFEYKGEVKGINTSALEGVPTMDKFNNFCFVSTREVKKTHFSLFCGNFQNGRVLDVQSIDNSLSKKKARWLNMGPEISQNGDTLYYTEASFEPGLGMPKTLNILVATRKKGNFYKVSHSDEIMRNINTDALEYAPAISSNGLELYFNRASEIIVGKQSQGVGLRIYMAKRKDISEPFESPRMITAIKGFVEGPTITEDGGTLYYHKKDDSRFYIYRVIRNK